jgi:phenylpropionate dioxygenase-like ring-hydroxylating dioxygenase large terminal subunit
VRVSSRFPYPPYANGWFRVAYSHELAAGAVVPLHYLGRDFVLLRDETGRAHVLDAFCPHLGAHLGHGGRVEGRAIRCPFHAWLFDAASGRCLDVPYAKKIPARARVRPWTVAERNGLVLLHHHAEQAPPVWEIPELPEVGSADWSPLEIRRWTVRSRWLDMNENAVDRVHFRYVHGTATIPESEVHVEGHVLRVRNRVTFPTPRGPVEGGLETTDHGPAFQTVRLTGILDTLMLNTATPIDEETTDVSFAYTVKLGGSDAARGLGAALIRDLEKQMEQDIVIWEHKTYWPRPLLCDGDGEIGTYRRWLRQFFSEAW